MKYQKIRDRMSHYVFELDLEINIDTFLDKGAGGTRGYDLKLPIKRVNLDA